MITPQLARPARPRRDDVATPLYSSADFDSRAEYEAARFRDGLLDGPVAAHAGALEQAVWGIKPSPKSRAQRVSQGITAEEFWRLHRGVARANLMGLVLNTFVTITWSTVGVTDPSEVSRCRSALLARLNKRMEARGMPHALIWVDEIGQFFGHHTHLLMHVDHFLRRKVAAWMDEMVETVTGQPPVIRAPNVKGTMTTTDVVKLSDDLESGQWFYFRYLMKGLLPDAVTPLPFRRQGELILGDTIKRRLEIQGEITGHRCGLTHFLGSAQERRYRERFDTIPEDWYEAGLAWFEVADPDLGIIVHGPDLYRDSFLRLGEGARRARSFHRAVDQIDEIFG